ncbi:MAG: class I SAM-dependent methyltransferase [Reyranella sp.]|uniref:class I SAM-dependent methyltransferase n=1 Tax=Reyranella sp. TaxID=1929291 RepID=UPI001ACB8BE2|nr:class I SAM-dependent methyltransferase [Reyranella sp.]MBN9088283.1 class I SAM-dependent methyltransferase [Reyranella sp.]
MLTWEKIDAVDGWYGFHSYALWRGLLDFQKAQGIRGDLFEIGVWRGRSAAVLASYQEEGETLYLCDLKVDDAAIRTAFESVGAAGRKLVAISAPSSQLPGRLDLRALHQSVRWMHIDGEHTGSAVYSELELAHQLARPDGLVVIDDFFSPRYPANTTEAVRYLEKNPFHFRLFAVSFNKGYFCRPESLAKYMDFAAGNLSEALLGYGCKTTLFKTTGAFDTDAIGITGFVDEAGRIAGPDNDPHYWNMLRQQPVRSLRARLRNAWRELRRRQG